VLQWLWSAVNAPAFVPNSPVVAALRCAAGLQLRRADWRESVSGNQVERHDSLLTGLIAVIV
jgi:hypothetical protein